MPPVLPQNLYESIKNEPFKIPEDDGNDLTHTFFNPDREGWLLKLGAWRAAGGTRCGPLRPDPAGAQAPGMAFVRRLAAPRAHGRCRDPHPVRRRPSCRVHGPGNALASGKPRRLSVPAAGASARPVPGCG